MICVKDLDKCPITSINLTVPNDDDTQYYEAATHLGKHNTLKWNSNDEIQTLRIREAYKTLTVGDMVPLL